MLRAGQMQEFRWPVTIPSEYPGESLCSSGTLFRMYQDSVLQAVRG